MQRQIEFRGFNRCTKTWSYAELKYILKEQAYNPIDYFKVDPDTVTQSIGMKDRSGKNIFEGDIVAIDVPAYDLSISSYPYTVERRLGVIEYDENNVTYKIQMEAVSEYVCEFTPHEIEIVGNIFENPDLVGWRNNKNAEVR